jgi:hypothetical protein
MKQIAIILFFSIFIFQCASVNKPNQNNKKMENSSKTTEFIYKMRDASVAPQYHRSYDISIKQDKGTLKVTNYSDVLLEQEFKVSKEEWEKLLKMSEGLTEKGQKIAQGATGTKGYNLQSYTEQERTYDFSWDSLSEPAPNTQEFVNYLKSIVKPSLNSQIEKTRE